MRKDEVERVCAELERELRSLTNLDTGGPAVARVVKAGDHREQGAFWITGPGIAAHAITSPVSITDFAPTIGQLLAVPLPVRPADPGRGRLSLAPHGPVRAAR